LEARRVGWVDDQLGIEYYADTIEKNSTELDVDQKDWVDDLLGVGYCVNSSGGRTRCRPEGLG
jgi:hypothetical protein